MAYHIPNWSTYQGYQKRGPKWVKLHVSLLRNRFWPKLSILARATLPALWIVASEQSQDGTFDDDIESLSHLVAMPVEELSRALFELKSFGFIDSDRIVAAHATEPAHQTEKRREETEAEKRDTHAPANADESDEIDAEEKTLMRLLVDLRDTGVDVSAVCDSLERPKGQAPFNAFRALMGGKSGIPRTPGGLTVRRRLIDALEARQRAQATPIVSANNKQAFDAIERVTARMIAQRDGTPVPKELAG